jgi:hypothetical protein
MTKPRRSSPAPVFLRIAALLFACAYLAVGMTVVWHGVTLGSGTELLGMIVMAVPLLLMLAAPRFPAHRRLMQIAALVVLTLFVMGMAAPHGGAAEKPPVCVFYQWLALLLLLIGVNYWPHRR